MRTVRAVVAGLALSAVLLGILAIQFFTAPPGRRRGPYGVD